MTGYEQSNDYGGPPPRLWGLAILVAIIVALSFWLVR